MNVLIRVRRRVSCGSTDTPRCDTVFLDECGGFREIFDGTLTSTTLSISDGSLWTDAIPAIGNSFALFKSAVAAAPDSSVRVPVSGALFWVSSLLYISYIENISVMLI